MTVSRVFLVVTALMLFASIGYAIYTLCWGPEPLLFSGKSLPELLQSDALAAAIGVVVSLAATWLIIRPFARLFFPAQIRNGVNTEARVLKVWDTGTTINDDPEVGFVLEFASADGTLFQVETKTVVSRLKAALVQPGITAQVRYDPQKPRRLRILALQLPDATERTAAARMQELQELLDKGLITGDEYRQKREEILRAL